MKSNSRRPLATWQWFFVGLGSTTILSLGILSLSKVFHFSSVSVASQKFFSKKTDANKLHGSWESKEAVIIFDSQGNLISYSSIANGSNKIAQSQKYETNILVNPHYLDFVFQWQGKELRQKLIFEFTPNGDLRMAGDQKSNMQSRLTRFPSGHPDQSMIFHRKSNETKVPSDFKVMTIFEASQIQTNRARSIEAKSGLGTINRAQHAFRLERNYFASSINDLDARISAHFYNFQITNSSRNDSYAVAIPQQRGLKSYSSAAGYDGHDLYAVICESNEPTTVPPSMPQHSNRNEYVCPPGSSLIK
jgi:aconitase A